jgi:FAD/FMN-containing dehydrogenase
VHSSGRTFALYATEPDSLYINFGFWKIVRSEKPEGYYNRLIEETVERLHGKKSLYSESCYTEKKFWELYDWDSYSRLKKKYDPQGIFKNLYQKCVLKR